MNQFFKLSAVAAALAASGLAFADTSETKGGVKIKTDDGRFEASIGGRIHFDGNLISEDTGAFNNNSAPGAGAGSNNVSNSANSGFYFRRIYLTLAGKLYGWTYKIENDFAGNNATGAASNGFQDVWLGTEIGPGEIQFGQRKAFRAMEDLTSSNDVLMIERPFASSSGGLFAGGLGSREFQDGLFYHGNGDNYTWGVSFTSLRAINTAGTEGVGTSTRGTFAPLNEEGSIVHLGANFSYERPANNQGVGGTAAPGNNTPATLGATAGYGARRGATATLGTTDNNVGTWGVEYANVFGPWFLQAEYYNQLQLASTKAANGGTAALENSAPTNQTIEAYYVQTSIFVTGESKPYKKKDGVFGNPKPVNDFGAFELTARYDSAKNKDNPTACAAQGGVGLGSVAVGTAGRDTCRVSAITLGTNYYVNPNVRFMLNYVIGNFDLGSGAGSDKPRALAARAQISF
jgi:phosphate-selective porin OprO/OprP